MPKVGTIGSSMLRGNEYNFYIRCDDDLDDQDCEVDRGAMEYPHIHVRTDGSGRHNSILYIGITFGGSKNNIDIYRDGGYQMSIDGAISVIRSNCGLISTERLQSLAQYLYGYRQYFSRQ